MKKLIAYLIVYLILLVPSFFLIMTPIALLVPESSGFLPCCDMPHVSDYLPGLRGSFLGGFPIYSRWYINLFWLFIYIATLILPFILLRLIQVTIKIVKKKKI